MKELRAGNDARPILFIEIHQELGAVKFRVIPAGAPEFIVQSRVEGIMNREKIADIIPGLRVVAVVKLDQSGSRLAQAVDQGVGQGAGLDTDDLQSSRFKWFDKSDGIPNPNDIADPVSDITPAPEFHQ